MFDRATCPDQARLGAQPSVSLISLPALAKLLQLTSSNASHPGASSSSHEQNRGEDNDCDSAGVSQHERTPEDEHRRPARTSTADRAVQRRAAQRPGGQPGVAGPAGGHAGRADQPDGTADPGARRGASCRSKGGGWS